MKKDILLTVKIDEVMYDHICREAKRDERAVSWMTRKLLEEALGARGLLQLDKQHFAYACKWMRMLIAVTQRPNVGEH